MTEPLTPARFVELAEAYGGTIARWPEAVRVAATEMARSPAMREVLDAADRLDARLDQWRVAAPAAALRQRIVALRRTGLSRRIRLWLSGLGVATALAGAAAGSVAAAAALPIDHAIADDATAFGDLGSQEN